MAKLIGSNVTICYACGALPGLTHPSQALSDVCSPPPSKTSIFGHLYMANLIHKHWDKQLHRCTHTLQLLSHAHLAQIFISTHAFSQNMPKTTDGHKYLCTTLHMHMHKYGTAETQHMPCMGTYMLWINFANMFVWGLVLKFVHCKSCQICKYINLWIFRLS